MFLEKQFDELIRLLSAMPDFSRFLCERSSKADIVVLLESDIQTFLQSQDLPLDFPKYVDLYRAKVSNSNSYSFDFDFYIKIVLGKYYALLNEANGISYVDYNLQIDAKDLLRDFFLKTSSDFQNGYVFKDAEVQKYKTIRECVAYRKVDYSNIYYDYIDCNHPYICTEIALAFINAKRFDIGLTFLKKTLIQVFVGQNKYWHNHSSVCKCFDALYELQHLMGPSFMFSFFSKEKSDPGFLLKCLYLYLSRAIYWPIPKTLEEGSISLIEIQQANYLSMRADLIYDYKNSFHLIFPLGVNPDIQFMSDKYMAYAKFADKGFGYMVQDCFWDSNKMYQNGSLWVNSTGGYRDIEEASFDQLVAKGHNRGLQLAMELYGQYKQWYFVLTMNQIDNLISSLYEKLVTGNSFR